jgi:UDP-N-acetylglucosamine:LPS N-acetylglucosamine transferase
MSKKVLIMSASTGGGHNRAARAIKEELESRTINDKSIECEIVDSLKLVNNTMDKVISRGYEKSAIYTPNAIETNKLGIRDLTSWLFFFNKKNPPTIAAAINNKYTICAIENAPNVKIPFS